MIRGVNVWGIILTATRSAHFMKVKPENHADFIFYLENI